ncbi:MAG TPA: hypothetical protein VJ302_01910 [Blastocatellia bacterium]|nr:hypothetical protein [Blastocatellia bacterium]
MADEEKVVYNTEEDQEWAEKDPQATARLLGILRFGLVEIEKATEPIEADGKRFGAGSHVVRLPQPSGGWAKTLLERQTYPDLRL